jgi:tetratricopeptide (TPR) repeat protein
VSGTTTHLIGVSIPRSGHHFLVDLLRTLLPDDFRYCEFYAADDCCRRVPCTRHGNARVFYQKHHDLDLSLPTALTGVRYVIQVRDPVMSTLSDREHIARHEGEKRATDRDEFLVWLGQKAAYYERFFEKWVLPRAGERIVIDYDDLLAQPAHVLRRLTTACGVDIDDERIVDAVAAISSVRSADRPGVAEAFTRRTLPTSRFLDPSLLPAFESLLLDRIARLRPKQRLETVDYTDHPVTLVYLAERARAAGDLDEAVHEIDRAIRIEPRNRHLLLVRVAILSAMNRTADAMATATAACELAPDDDLCLRKLSDLHLSRSNDDLLRARALADRLVALQPGDPGHRTHLATILRRLGDHAAARDQALRALGAQPRDPYVWRYASEVLVACQDRAGAIDAVRGAIGLAPEVGEFHHHLANLLASDGRIADAAASHARAIALDPDQRAWHWKYGEDLRQAGDVAGAREVVQAALARFPGDPRLAAQLDRL